MPEKLSQFVRFDVNERSDRYDQRTLRKISIDAEWSEVNAASLERYLIVVGNVHASRIYVRVEIFESRNSLATSCADFDDTGFAARGGAGTLRSAGCHLTMHNGTVKKWVGERGFGFIVPDDGGDDIFVHISNCDKRGLSAGQKVRYDEITSERTHRPEAVNVVSG